MTAELEVTPVFRKMQAADTPVVISYGGADSGKSHGMSQLIVLAFLSYPGIQILVTCKTLPQLKATAMKQVLARLDELGYMEAVAFNKSDLKLSFRGSLIWFSSTDDPGKRKSEEWHIIWMEEATEFNFGDYKELRRRLRAARLEGLRNQLYLTLNPEDENSWIRKETAEPYCTAIHSTVDDNPFAHPEDIEVLESEKDETQYKIYRLGQWGSRRGIIYTNWDYANEMPDGVLVRGLDFGFNNKMALVDIVKNNTDIHIRERIYESGMTNSDLIERMKILYPTEQERQVEIFADPSSKSEIEEIYRAGFNIHPADNDVLAGIMHVKQFNIYMVDSPHIEQERMGYKWKIDKNENALDQPTKENDHLMDAIRYGIFTPFKSEFRKPIIETLW